MSHPQGQKPVQPSNQSLTGCFYQVIQTGLPGSNVLKLLPILKPKDNPLPAVPSPVTPSASALNLPPAVISSPPPAPPPPPVSIISRPSPVRVPLVQTPAFGNYILTAQNNLTSALHVENPFALSQETALFLDNSQVSFPTNPVPGNPTIFMMNQKLVGPVKPTPVLPSGHSLQIPAHAEVRSVPASSLPFAVQQKILSQSSGSDIGRIPSVIYVSPVNTVKAHNNQIASLYPSPVSSSITPAGKSCVGQKPPSSGTEASNGPMKWVVHENKEAAAACLVPVKSSCDTASKILQMLSKTKMEDVSLTSSDPSKAVQVKDNALVMCNNKIFFLAKKGTELIDAGSKNPEPPPDKPAPQIEPMKDFSNRVVQVVLSKNKSPPPGTEQSVQSDVVSTPKPKRKSSTPQANRGDPNVLRIPGGGEGGRSNVSVKPQDAPCSPSNPAGSSNVNAANEGESGKKTDQLLPKSKDPEIVPAAKAPEVKVMDDRSWRLRFGLVKKEKIILKRIPLIGAPSSSRSDSRPQLHTSSPVRKDAKDPAEMQLKRKSPSEQTAPSSKKQKSAGGPVSADVPPDSPSSSPVSSYSAVPGGRNPLPIPRDFETTEASRSIWSPSYYGEDSTDFHQDTAEHFSPASLPRFHIDSLSSMYSDETTKDEKIQRLKEVLEEREKALEALRHQRNV